MHSVRRLFAFSICALAKKGVDSAGSSVIKWTAPLRPRPCSRAHYLETGEPVIEPPDSRQVSSASSRLSKDSALSRAPELLLESVKWLSEGAVAEDNAAICPGSAAHDLIISVVRSTA